MSKPRFDELRERLLRAGIAPSHVQRYVRELREHYEDLYRAESARGLPPLAAQDAAREKLGSDDALAESVLAQPELRSVASRYPALVFGAAPLVLWAGLAWTAARTLQSLAESYFSQSGANVPDGFVRILELYCLVLIRVLPLLLAAAVMWSAMRRRSSARWPIIGATLMTIAAASIVVVVDDSPQVGMMTCLLPGLRSPVLGGYDSLELRALAESALRASWMLALTLVPYGLWHARRAHASRG